MSRCLLKFSKRSLRIEILRGLDDLNKRFVGRRLLACFARAARRAGRCLYAFNRRKPLNASSVAAAAHRRAIKGERQYMTLRQTLRTVPMAFSMMLVRHRGKMGESCSVRKA
jgi:hypothetical protein